MAFIKNLVLLCFTFTIPLTAFAADGKIATCDTYDPPPTQAELNEYESRKKFSGLVIEDSSNANQLMEFIAANSSSPDSQQKVLGRDWADLKNAHILLERTIGNSICALVEGEIAYRAQVTPDFFPAPDPEPIFSEALKKERFFIPVLSAGILEGSLWTDQQIKDRFEKIREVYQQCGVDVDSLDIKMIPNPDHKFDDIDDDMDPRDSRFLISPFEKKMAQTLAPANLHAPALLYLKNVWNMDVVNKLEMRNCTADARAFIMGKVVPKDSPIAGMALIVDGYSIVKGGQGCTNLHKPTAYLTDAHELGHLLLNDGGHSDQRENVMYGFPDDSKGLLDDDQCAKIRASPFVHHEPRS